MINGEKITLGPLKPSDFDSLFRWSNNPEIARMNESLRPQDWPSQHERWMNSGKDPSKVIFAIRPREQPGIIGFLQIGNIDAIHHTALIGLTIGEIVNRRQGFGTEAMRLAIDYCWNHLNLSRLSLTVFQHNEAGLRLYQRTGFKKEGVLRRALFIDGRWIDVVIMAALHPKRRNG
jgi:RimJ/RimL family protein N-acetyltransferase